MRHTPTSVVALCVGLLTLSAAASETITTNQQWSGTVTLTANVTVTNGAVLRVQPGATLIMHEGISIVAEGGAALRFQGTAARPITVRAASGASSWGSLLLQPSAAGTSVGMDDAGNLQVDAGSSFAHLRVSGSAAPIQWRAAAGMVHITHAVLDGGMLHIQPAPYTTAYVLHTVAQGLVSTGATLHLRDSNVRDLDVEGASAAVQRSELGNMHVHGAQEVALDSCLVTGALVADTGVSRVVARHSVFTKAGHVDAAQGVGVAVHHCVFRDIAGVPAAVRAHGPSVNMTSNMFDRVLPANFVLDLGSGEPGEDCAQSKVADSFFKLNCRGATQECALVRARCPHICFTSNVFFRNSVRAHAMLHLVHPVFQRNVVANNTNMLLDGRARALHLEAMPTQDTGAVERNLLYSNVGFRFALGCGSNRGTRLFARNNHLGHSQPARVAREVGDMFNDAGSDEIVWLPYLQDRNVDAAAFEPTEEEVAALFQRTHGAAHINGTAHEFERSLVVEEGSTLTILRDTELRFGEGAGLIVRGSLVLQPSPLLDGAQPITLGAAEGSEAWGGVHVYSELGTAVSSEEDGSVQGVEGLVFDGVHFQGGGAAGVHAHPTQGDLVLTNCQGGTHEFWPGTAHAQLLVSNSTLRTVAAHGPADAALHQSWLAAATIDSATHSVEVQSCTVGDLQVTSTTGGEREVRVRQSTLGGATLSGGMGVELSENTVSGGAVVLDVPNHVVERNTFRGPAARLVIEQGFGLVAENEFDGVEGSAVAYRGSEPLSASVFEGNWLHGCRSAAGAHLVALRPNGTATVRYNTFEHNVLHPNSFALSLLSGGFSSNRLVNNTADLPHSDSAAVIRLGADVEPIEDNLLANPDISHEVKVAAMGVYTLDLSNNHWGAANADEAAQARVYAILPAEFTVLPLMEEAPSAPGVPEGAGSTLCQAQAPALGAPSLTVHPIRMSTLVTYSLPAQASSLTYSWGGNPLTDLSAAVQRGGVVEVCLPEEVTISAIVRSSCDSRLVSNVVSAVVPELPSPAAPPVLTATANDDLTVTLDASAAVSRQEVKYSTDGSTPIPASATLRAPLTVCNNQRTVVSLASWLPCRPELLGPRLSFRGSAVPVVTSPAGTNLGGTTTVKLAPPAGVPADNVELRYTLDGSEPRADSALYDNAEGIVLSQFVATRVTLRARAFSTHSGCASDTLTVEYTMPRPTFQWFMDDVPIVGVDCNRLPYDGPGTYRVVVSNEVGTSTSVAVLTEAA